MFLQTEVFPMIVDRNEYNGISAVRGEKGKMKSMTKFIKYCLCSLLAAFLFFEAAILGILLFPSGTFASSYQATIQDKEKLLRETNDPKIIFVAGSSGAFGLNAPELEEASGYKVVNLGLHAGFGFSFISEIAKANINPGDIVLLGYEYNWTEEDAFTEIGADLVMSGIDDKISMYRYVLPSQWKSVIGYLFSYAAQKNEFEGMDGVYSRSGFSDNGNQMIVERTETYVPKPENEHTVEPDISEPSKQYLLKLRQYIESKGASVYFVQAPYAVSTTKNQQDLLLMVQNEESEIGIPYLSDPIAYGFPDDLMWDTTFHCNSKGEEIRTKLLIRDLKKSRVIK